MTLKDFLSRFGSTLKEIVSRRNIPTYDPANEGPWEEAMRQRLEALKRPPFPRQAETILALLKGFRKNGIKGLFLTWTLAIFTARS